jgi:hypothetical protein
MKIKHPKDLVWHDGPLPDITTVSKNSWFLVWVIMIESQELAFVEMVHPYENELNPLRWCDSSGFPLGGSMCGKHPSETIMQVVHWAQIWGN